MIERSLLIYLFRFKNSIKVYINHVLQLKSPFLVQNIKLYYDFGVKTILRRLHRCPKVKTNFATCPKLGHGREHDLGLRFVLRWS